MARPIASGRNPIVRIPRGHATSEMGAILRIEMAKATVATAATNRNHLICCRSTPEERRKRSSRLASASRKVGGAPKLLIVETVVIQVSHGSGGTDGLS